MRSSVYGWLWKTWDRRGPLRREDEEGRKEDLRLIFERHKHDRK